MTNRTRARWAQNGTDSWILKLPVKDGGAVLARIEKRGGYQWTAYTTPIQVGTGVWLADTKRAARRALRETENNV